MHIEIQKYVQKLLDMEMPVKSSVLYLNYYMNSYNRSIQGPRNMGALGHGAPHFCQKQENLPFFIGSVPFFDTEWCNHLHLWPC